MPEIEIRDNPKFRSFFRNVTEMTFTGFVWGIWLYLLMPVVNIILWILGINVLSMSIFEQVNYSEFLHLIQKMGWIILTVFLILRLWAFYNYVAFGKKSKRRASSLVTIENLAAQYDIPVDRIREMQQQKEVHWQGLIMVGEEELIAD
ncbi:MAG: poly-beta-1,6-N-acetyl-D-glucosamine biosynthesis protein PgaD [Nitrospira sp.]|nr:poly-beta-1,6-N-acetyl-D-glucosamine biosynthesis protein PgaD [bacterium]MBL7049790.1 poly-beta-1,6-N-acetyl-D-glucosamine biosynthesis protein PgaD [Nitrospira sp.]